MMRTIHKTFLLVALLFISFTACKSLNSHSGCIKGQAYLDASANWPLANNRLTLIGLSNKDTIQVYTNFDGTFQTCGIRSGQYAVWAFDSTNFNHKPILDDNGEYVINAGGYNIPSIANTHIRNIKILSNDTLNMGSFGLYYPASMSTKK